MDKQVNIEHYQPDVIKDYREFKAIAQTENPELYLLWTASDNAFNDQFVDTLTINGCERWEKMLGIQPMGTDTLEERRFRIKARLNENLPYTMRMLKNSLSALCGADGYSLTLYAGEYRLKILVELTVKKMFAEAESMVKRMIPANMIIDISLRYNQWLTLKPLTWGQAAGYTWGGIREEVIENGNDN